MPSSAVHAFTEPDDYAATVRGGTVDLTITVRGNFIAKLTRIDLHCLRMQRLHDNLPRIAEATNIINSRHYISFRTRPGPSVVQAAVELQTAGVLQHGPANEYHQRSSGPAGLGTMSLPFEDMEAAAACQRIWRQIRAKHRQGRFQFFGQQRLMAREQRPPCHCATRRISRWRLLRRQGHLRNRSGGGAVPVERRLGADYPDQVALRGRAAKKAWRPLGERTVQWLYDVFSVAGTRRGSLLGCGAGALFYPASNQTIGVEK
jgi:hypothetical protein